MAFAAQRHRHRGGSVVPTLRLDVLIALVFHLNSERQTDGREKIVERMHRMCR